MRRAAPLFLVSAGALGFEIALTRFFAVALWNEYGYWVISIAMAGFAFSGVVLALAGPWPAARTRRLLAWLPVALTLAGGIGFHFVIANRFNPLALQNPVTWTAELPHIAAYYAALLPFFFLAGLFVGLCFLAAPGALGAVYAADLAGAGAGAAALVGAMFLLPPFRLVAALLPVLAAAAGRGARRAALAALVAAEALLWFGAQPHISQYKPIFAPAHTQGARVVARLQRPSGTYALLDDFTERVDVDLSDDAAMLHLPGPPRALGLYRDGVRIAALPFPGQAPTAAYAPATLGALAYRLAPSPRVLLVGGGGGFRVAAARALGARSVRVLEPEPVLRAALRRAMPGLAVSARSPLALAHGARWDLIDLAADQLATAPPTEAAFAAEPLAADLRHLTRRGVLSVPVSIRDFPVYALRVLATVRRALRLAGIADAGAHVIMVRSAWTVRVLVSPRAFGPRAVAVARRFCDRRSFDLSWYPGIDVRAARAGIFNDLPPISFAAGTVRRGGPRDAIADEAGAVLARRPSASAAAFSLAPMTLDRPFFFAALRLADLPTLLRRLEVLPQPEIAALVNLAVLAQAALIALAVLALPLAAPGIGGRGGFPAMAVFFPSLGLGFLFLELWLIAKATLWLDDAATGFAAVLSLMLIASGAGAALSARARHPTRAVALAGSAVLGWAVAARVGLWPLILASLAWPEPARIGLLALVIAPLGLALGVPFPLGLARIGAGAPRRLAWAWGLNGAFSVLATPAAQLLARVAGWNAVLSAAMMLYAASLLSFPLLRSAPAWSRLPRPPPRPDAA